MSSPRRNLKADLRTGIGTGLGFAAACSVMATIAFGLSVLMGSSQELTTALGLNFPTAISTYLVGGLMGGVIFGLLQPLRSSVLGSFTIGTLSSFPISLGFMPAAVSRADWFPEGVIVALAISMIIGGGLGAVYHAEPQSGK